MASGPEAEWQAQVVELATLLGWEHLHVRKSIGSGPGGRKWQTTTNVKGWPDLLLWHCAQRRRVALELKVGRNTATPEQLAVLAQLLESGMVDAALVVYPEDLDLVHQVLRRPANTAKVAAT